MDQYVIVFVVTSLLGALRKVVSSATPWQFWQQWRI